MLLAFLVTPGPVREREGVRTLLRMLDTYIPTGRTPERCDTVYFLCGISEILYVLIFAALLPMVLLAQAMYTWLWSLITFFDPTLAAAGAA